MLGDEKHRNNEQLKTVLADYWARLYPNKPSVQKDLSMHWNNLLTFNFKEDTLNQNTLKTARAVLIKKGYVAITYNGLKDTVKRTTFLKDFSFSQVFGSNINAFNGGNKNIPGFYTKEGYDKIIVLKGKDLVKEVLLNNWVLGSHLDLSDSEINTIYAQVLSMYFKDYKRYWLESINTLTVTPKQNIAGLTNQLEILISADSPIVSVLKAIKFNTELYSPAELLIKEAKSSSSLLNKIAKIASKNAILAANKSMPSTSVKNVRTFFNPFNKLLDKELNVKPDLQNAVIKLNDVFKEMTGVYSSLEMDRNSYQLVVSRINGTKEPIIVNFNAIPIQISKWYKSVLISNWKFLLNQSHIHISKKYQENVLSFYKDNINNKYPFKRKHYKETVDIDNFVEYFKVQGIFDNFYTEYVSHFVNINQKNNNLYKLKVIDGITMKISKDFMKNYIAANNIREMMFTNNGQALSVPLSIKAHSLEKTLSTMKLVYDNQKIVYEHGPIKRNKMMWPKTSTDDLVNFELYNLSSENIYEENKTGTWALFQLIDQFNTKKVSKNAIIFEYLQGKYLASMYLEGSIAKIFTRENPLGRFSLKDNF
jgi:type VI secretion system protein ImpL